MRDRLGRAAHQALRRLRDLARGARAALRARGKHPRVAAGVGGRAGSCSASCAATAPRFFFDARGREMGGGGTRSARSRHLVVHVAASLSASHSEESTIVAPPPLGPSSSFGSHRCCCLSPRRRPLSRPPRAMIGIAMYWYYECFEGMKAYKGADGSLRLFRSDCKHGAAQIVDGAARDARLRRRRVPRVPQDAPPHRLHFMVK